MILIAYRFISELIADVQEMRRIAHERYPHLAE
jgi:hypothetical protein